MNQELNNEVMEPNLALYESFLQSNALLRGESSDMQLKNGGTRPFQSRNNLGCKNSPIIWSSHEREILTKSIEAATGLSNTCGEILQSRAGKNDSTSVLKTESDGIASQVDLSDSSVLLKLLGLEKNGIERSLSPSKKRTNDEMLFSLLPGGLKKSKSQPQEKDYKEILPQNDHSRSKEMEFLEIPKQVRSTKILQVKCSKGEPDLNDLELGREKVFSEIEKTPDIEKGVTGDCPLMNSTIIVPDPVEESKVRGSENLDQRQRNPGVQKGNIFMGNDPVKWQNESLVFFSTLFRVLRNAGWLKRDIFVALEDQVDDEI